MRKSRFGLVKQSALLSAVLFIASTPAHAHRPIAPLAPTESICEEMFGRFGRIAQRIGEKPVYTEEHFHEIAAVHDGLILAARADAQLITANSAEISEGTLQIAGQLTRKIAEDLGRQGYDVRVVRRPMTSVFVDGIELNIGEREVIELSAGSAQGKFARELKRYEKDVRARLKDPKLAPEVKRKSFPVSIDPLLSFAHATASHFSPTEINGNLGVALSPSLLAERGEKVVEVMRHEIRHLKEYFDTVSEKETVGIAALINATPKTLEQKRVYTKRVPIDEMFTYESQARTAQQELGRLTEEMQRAIDSDHPPTKTEIAGFIRDVESLRTRGKGFSKIVSEISTASKENAVRLRARLADPSMTTERFASRIAKRNSISYPNRQVVFVRIDDRIDPDAAYMEILVPDEIVHRGNRALREFIIKYCTSLENSATAMDERIAVRIRDLDRDAMSRVQSKPRKLTEPTTN